MNIQYPLTVYYDASCAMCRTEIHNIKLHDAENRLRLVDCSATNFDDSPFQQEGITRAAMMEKLHVCDNRGMWTTGARSIELLYRSVNMNILAKLWGNSPAGRVAERLYPWVARHRQTLSRIGIPWLFVLAAKYASHRALKRSQQCAKGKCSI